MAVTATSMAVTASSTTVTTIENGAFCTCSES
jgi:hypothetical protein